MPTLDSVFAAVQQANLPAEAISQLATANQSVKRAATAPLSITRTAVFSPSSQNIVLFSGFDSSPKAAEDLLAAYGDLIYQMSGETGKTIWEQKLVLANPDTGNLFNERLRQSRFSTFKALVESFDGAVQRLEALHIANAFIYNKVPITSAYGIDVTKHPMTAEFAGGRKPYSAVPLISAYVDQDIWQDFKVAFSRRISNTLSCGRADVKDLLVKTIDSVCESCESSR